MNRPSSRRRCGAASTTIVIVLASAALASPRAQAAGTGMTPPAAVQAAVADPASRVNSFVGTASRASTVPGAAAPFGMVQWSPETTDGDQTRTTMPGGYDYATTRARGFSLTHVSGTGCAGASGDIPFYPHAGAVTTSPSADTKDAIYASNFTHAAEQAAPGSYQVTLKSGVKVALAAAARSGAGQFTFPAGATQTLLVRTSNSEVGSSDARTTIDPKTRSISGSVTSGNFCGYIGTVNRRSYYTLHFHAVFDTAFAGTGTWRDRAVKRGAKKATGGTTYDRDGFPGANLGSGGWVSFAPKHGRTVGVRVGISYVSLAGAKANLAREVPAGTGYAKVASRTRAAWNGVLRGIEIRGGTTAQQTTFYTALYHSLQHPNLFSDVDGRYVGMDGKVHAVKGKQRAQYANFSGWDVYRSQLQLLTLVRPDVGADIAQSLLNQADQNGGVWDRWTHNQGGTHVMTGDPAHAALPSIYAFGGRGFDAARALTSMGKAASTVTPADLSDEGWNVAVVGERPSLDQYLKLGYVSAQGKAWGGAGETLEDTSADFALSQLATRLGQKSLARRFLKRSDNWRNVMHKGYAQDRNADGTWPESTPDSENGFAEGTSAQYTWMVPYNQRGLFGVLGGTATARKRLDQFFHDADGTWDLLGADGAHADLSNEPSVGTPWLYDFAGQPYKTQEAVRRVVDTLWSDKPDGLPGQDDLGAMSSWYVWAALGMYPLTPGRAELLLASPLFPRITVHHGPTVTLEVTAKGPAGAAYVHGLTVDGTASNRAWLPEGAVTKGASLVFTTATTPDTTWGARASDAPPSFPAPAKS